ncbi:unnamed protein product [Bursaphelenchus xylophilus]|uniref:(pine wood nematode) hypothetical protein n=1 Tax=Bursaphelenchus xylophilus TaxID=6326 RepID=A0A7I8WID1_BURXY|nr:unnamed protein product [Bursaphelenchus xylophilus]CAG9108942.1 unnamed protein product [Bursaphelenchus xylophilus]
MLTYLITFQPIFVENIPSQRRTNVIIRDSHYRRNISYRLLGYIGVVNAGHMILFIMLVPYGFTCERQRFDYIAVTGVISNFAYYVSEPLGVLLAVNRYMEICVPRFKTYNETKNFYDASSLLTFIIIIVVSIWMFTGEGCHVYYFCYRYSYYKDCPKAEFIRGRSFMVYACLLSELIIYLITVGHIAAQRTITGEKLRLMTPEKRLLIMCIIHFVNTAWRQGAQHVNNVFFVYSPLSQVSSVTAMALSDVINAILPLIFNRPLLMDTLTILKARKPRLFSFTSLSSTQLSIQQTSV